MTHADGSSRGSGPLEGRAASYQGGLTRYVLLVAAVAASGGLQFGYNLGVTGGVEAMPSFLQHFFPDVYASKQAAAASPDATDPYCVFNSETLSLYTSLYFLAGLLTAPPASALTRKHGRKASMLIGGLLTLLGTVLNTAAQNRAMLNSARVFLGIALGFTNGACPIYLSEMAPAAHRGQLNLLFQLCTTFGIFSSGLINYGTSHVPWGWRLSLGLAAIPASMLTVGGLLLPDSPASLEERGRPAQARRVLERVRGTTDVDAEYADIQQAAAQSRQYTQLESWRNLLQRRHRPSLVLAAVVPVAQQWTGVDCILFYVPVMLSSFGSGDKAALINSAIVGGTLFAFTIVAIRLVDRAGRRPLLFSGNAVMTASMVATAVLLAVVFSRYNTATLPSGAATGILVCICCFIAAYSWSWGGLGWLIPAEIQPLATRSAGFSLSVSANFLSCFILAQCFLPMLCAMKWGTYLFFAALLVLNTAFVYWLVPEMRGVPQEDIYSVYTHHKFWGPLIAGAEQEEQDEKQAAEGKSDSEA